MESKRTWNLMHCESASPVFENVVVKLLMCNRAVQRLMQMYNICLTHAFF
jgi:hypothetical protein